MAASHRTLKVQAMDLVTTITGWQFGRTRSMDRRGFSLNEIVQGKGVFGGTKEAKLKFMKKSCKAK